MNERGHKAPLTIPRADAPTGTSITLYGITKSRAGRTMWALEEIGLAYEQVPIDFREGATRTSEYLAVNPNGRIPTLVGDDLVLYESMAINHYLAERYAGGIRPSDAGARALMWSFWSTNETENLRLSLIRNRLALDARDRDPDAADRAEALLEAPLAILDAHLSDTKSSHLVGDRFGVADINVAFGLI